MTTEGTLEPGKQPEGNPPDVAKNTENQPGPGPIPYERFKEVNDQYKAMKSQLDDLLAEKEKRDKAQKEAEEKRLEAQKEFEQLATERKAQLEDATEKLTSIQGQLNEQTAVLQSLYDSRKSLVPEMFQPLLDGMDLVKRLQWIAENEAKLKPASNGSNGIPNTPMPKGAGEITPEQRRAKARSTW